MRPSVRCLEIRSAARSESEMSVVGVDPAGVRIMAPKQFHYNLKVAGLTPAQANVLKQDALAIGAEAAIAKGAASCTVKSTDAIVSGTLKELKALAAKLEHQSFGLPAVGRALEEALRNLDTTGFRIEGRSSSWELSKRTLIMGILNVTPDSFSDGGRFFEKTRAIERALEMVEEGADWVDIGAESTRPGAEPVSIEEELRRVVPVVEAVSKAGVAVSIDTTKARVAASALDAGAEMVNDISALSFDPDMASVCAEHGAPVVLMHMRGTPKTMQADTRYDDLTGEVFEYLLERIEYATRSGIKFEKIIIDPGIGFGKSGEGNLELLNNLGEFKTLGRPILVGASRKSFISRTVGEKGDVAAGTISVNTAAILRGANALRVHDIKEARSAAVMADAIMAAGL